MTTDPEELRRRYVADQVMTAGPAQRLVMLLDRFVNDLRCADAAFDEGSTEQVHTLLVHSQQIVLALRDPLRDAPWEGAGQLRGLYLFVYHRLVQCNLNKDRSLLPMCLEIVSKLRDANVTALERETTASAGVA